MGQLGKDAVKLAIASFHCRTSTSCLSYSYVPSREILAQCPCRYVLTRQKAVDKSKSLIRIVERYKGKERADDPKSKFMS